MKKIFLIVILLITFIITGCGKKDVIDETSSIKPEPIVEKKLQIIDLDSKTRPYAVMINNIGVARQVQSGLQDAYVVYELIVEGGITRLLALFKDVNTERIGSIRSARHYYLDYALEHDAIYVHIGESPQAKSDIKTLKVTELPGSTWYYRENPLKLASEHTAFTSISKMDKIKNSSISRKETSTEPLLNYSIEEHNYEGDKANNINIKYSNSMTANYEYNEKEKVYYRSVNNKKHVDYVTKKQLTFKNIIAYAVENYTLPDDKSRQEIKNIGSGSGVYISNGISTKITWEKKSRSAKTTYNTLDGKELIVNDGNTFIQIYPKSGSITIN